MAEPLVTVETIDLVLREAQVCNAQLNCIHHLLNHDPDREDEESPRNMEANTAMIFRDMGCLPFDRKIWLACRKYNGKRFTSLS